jgi:hypothetical protein
MTIKVSKIKKEQRKPAKKVEAQNQVGSPKWGTMEWIMAYPWSRMDKNRRRRVRQVLKNEDKSLFEPIGMASEYIDYLCKLLAKANIDIPKRTVKDTMEAATEVDYFILCSRDELIAQALYRRWCADKPCAGCSDKKKSCKKSCNKPCKQTCKKSSKAKN